MDCSDLRLSLPFPSLNHKSEATFPFWPRDKTPRCDSQSKWGGKKQKAGRDRVEISIHLKEEGCVLSTEARLLWEISVYEKEVKMAPKGRRWGGEEAGEDTEREEWGGRERGMRMMSIWRRWTPRTDGHWREENVGAVGKKSHLE